MNSKRFPAWEFFIEDISGKRIFLAVEGAYGGPFDLASAPEDASVVTAQVGISISPDGTFLGVFNTTQPSITYTIANWNSRFTSRSAGPFPR